MTRTKLLPVLAVALVVPLAACSSGSSSSSPTTASTAGASSGSSGSSGSGSGSSGSSGSTQKAATSGSSTGAAGAKTLDCKKVAEVVPESFAEPVKSVEDLGGSCTIALGLGDKVEVVWNRFASNDGSFSTVAGGLTPVKIVGASRAVGGFDGQGAQVKALVDGQGTYQLALTPDYVSARSATQADVDKLATLAAAIIAKG